MVRLTRTAAAQLGMSTRELIFAAWLVTLAAVVGIVISVLVPDQAGAGIAIASTSLSAGVGYAFGHQRGANRHVTGNGNGNAP